jgi:hypothetical protein
MNINIVLTYTLVHLYAALYSNVGNGIQMQGALAMMSLVFMLCMMLIQYKLV